MANSVAHDRQNHGRLADHWCNFVAGENRVADRDSSCPRADGWRSRGHRTVCVAVGVVQRDRAGRTELPAVH